MSNIKKGKKFYAGAQGISIAKSPAPENWFHAPKHHRFPNKNDFNGVNLCEKEKLKKFIRQQLLVGYSPQEKLFSKESNIFTMGSCFAAHITKELETRRGSNGYNRVLHTPSSVNNTFALQQFFHWVFTGDMSDHAYWHEGGAKKWAPAHSRLEYLNWILEADGFIFTLGLSEVWKDKQTDKVFWRAVPKNVYQENAERYSFELSTVEQNTRNIENVIQLIHEYLGGKPIILTLSPVPLKATFRGISCIPADCVSKAILRVAIDNIISLNHEHVYYWPSYEVIKEASSYKEQSAFDIQNCPRHVKAPIVEGIISTFLGVYFE